MFTQVELYWNLHTYYTYLPKGHPDVLAWGKQQILRLLWKYLQERTYFDKEHPLENAWLDACGLTYAPGFDVPGQIKIMNEDNFKVYQEVKWLWLHSGSETLLPYKDMAPEEITHLSDILYDMRALQYDRIHNNAGVVKCPDLRFGANYEYVDQFDPYLDYYALQLGDKLPHVRPMRETMIDNIKVRGSVGLFTTRLMNAHAVYNANEFEMVRKYYEVCGIEPKIIWVVNAYTPHADYGSTFEFLMCSCYENWREPTYEVVTKTIYDEWASHVEPEYNKPKGGLLSRLNLK